MNTKEVTVKLLIGSCSIDGIPDVKRDGNVVILSDAWSGSILGGEFHHPDGVGIKVYFDIFIPSGPEILSIFNTKKGEDDE